MRNLSKGEQSAIFQRNLRSSVALIFSVICKFDIFYSEMSDNSQESPLMQTNFRNFNNQTNNNIRNVTTTAVSAGHFLDRKKTIPCHHVIICIKTGCTFPFSFIHNGVGFSKFLTHIDNKLRGNSITRIGCLNHGHDIPL